MPPQPIAIAVVEREGCFLVGRRADSAALGGYWEFPGGKVEPGESPAAAAVRECHEETGLEVAVVGEYPSRTQAYEHATVDLRFFACRPCDLAQSPRLPYGWMPRAQLRDCQFPAGNRDLLDLLLAGV